MYSSRYVNGLPKSEYWAQYAPSADDDVTRGYGGGSAWFSTVYSALYLCVDPSEGAASWKCINNIV